MQAVGDQSSTEMGPATTNLGNADLWTHIF